MHPYFKPSHPKPSHQFLEGKEHGAAVVRLPPLSNGHCRGLRQERKCPLASFWVNVIDIPSDTSGCSKLAHRKVALVVHTEQRPYWHQLHQGMLSHQCGLAHVSTAEVQGRLKQKCSDVEDFNYIMSSFRVSGIPFSRTLTDVSSISVMKHNNVLSTWGGQVA